MKRNFSIITLVVILVMMLSIVGCSKKASVDTSAPSKPAASEPAASTPTEPAAAPTDQAAAPAAAPTDQTASTQTQLAPGAPAAPAKPGSPAPAAPAKPAASQTTASAPAAPSPAASTAPASLTGDKAKAYTLLAGCKYDGKADGDFAATIYKVPIMGDTDMTVTTTSGASSSKMTTKGVPSIVGGDSTNASFASVPFSEAVSGNPAALEAFLKSAGSVTVSGSSITVSNTQATSSFVTLLNRVSAKVTWTKAKVKLNYTITVGSGKVTSIKVSTVSASCTASGNSYDAKVSGTVNY